MALTKTPIELSSTPSIVDGGNATAITIDSSENVLVGKTSLAIANEGVVFEKGGAAEFTTDAARVMRLNRTSSDGSVLEINKDGTTVGTIGVSSGTPYISAATGGGMKFTYYNSTNAVMFPVTTTGANADAVHDIGHPSVRFKDLYLSGGAYLGGTGAANKLEDYEYGTWTPVIAGCTISIGRANYVKIGGLVKLDFNVVITGNDNSGSPMLMTGVPFTASSANSESVGSPMLRYFDFDSGATDVVMYHYSRTPTIEFYEVSDDSNWSLLRRDQIASNSAAIIGTITITVD